jgi:hypothetical protein
LPSDAGTSAREINDQFRAIAEMFSFFWMDLHDTEYPPLGCKNSWMELYLMAQQLFESMVPSFHVRRNIWIDYEMDTGQRLLSIQELLDLQRLLEAKILHPPPKPAAAPQPAPAHTSAPA